MNTMVAQRKQWKNKITMTNYLFFDTETTGLPLDWSVPPHFFKTWPHLVTLSWRFYENQKLIDQQTYVIQPDTYDIPLEATKIHGYTTERAKKEGVPSETALTYFFPYVKQANVIVAHNASFDISVIQAECYRRNLRCPLVKALCTMKSTIHLCRLPSRQGFKYPKLSELYLFLFQKVPENTHSSDVDTRLVSECFFALQEKYSALKWECLQIPYTPRP